MKHKTNTPQKKTIQEIKNEAPADKRFYDAFLENHVYPQTPASHDKLPEMLTVDYSTAPDLVIFSGEDAVATVWLTSNTESLAAEIARRYNLFPQLVEALKHIEERIRTVQPGKNNPRTSSFCQSLADIAAAALKAAENK